MQVVNIEHCNILTFGLELTAEGHIALQVEECSRGFFFFCTCQLPQLYVLNFVVCVPRIKTAT
jgi:hypothetical protein